MPMKNLLKTITECIDSFAKRENINRLAAIIGGEALSCMEFPEQLLI